MTARTAGPVLARRALRVTQASDAPLYMFSLTAGEILQVADISRVSRDDAGDLIGYQRPEVRQHIQEITDYLDGDQVLFPNPIIIALPSTRQVSPAAAGPAMTTAARWPGPWRSRFLTGRAEAWLDRRRPAAGSRPCPGPAAGLPGAGQRVRRRLALTCSATSSCGSTTPGHCPAGWSPNSCPRSARRCRRGCRSARPPQRCATC